MIVSPSASPHESPVLPTEEVDAALINRSMQRRPLEPEPGTPVAGPENKSVPVSPVPVSPKLYTLFDS